MDRTLRLTRGQKRLLAAFAAAGRSRPEGWVLWFEAKTLADVTTEVRPEALRDAGLLETRRDEAGYLRWRPTEAGYRLLGASKVRLDGLGAWMLLNSLEGYRAGAS